MLDGHVKCKVCKIEDFKIFMVKYWSWYCPKCWNTQCANFKKKISLEIKNGKNPLNKDSNE